MSNFVYLREEQNLSIDFAKYLYFYSSFYVVS